MICLQEDWQLDPQEMSQITRRRFIKQTSLAGVSIYVLSQGIALADDYTYSGIGCPPKTTKTNNGTASLKRTDKWNRHINTNTGATFYLRTPGAQSYVSGQPPGSFDNTTSFVKDNTTCNYIKEAVAPVTTVTSETQWALSTGNPPSSSDSGDTLPNPPGDWQWQSVQFQATYTKSQTWSATQSYILQ